MKSNAYVWKGSFWANGRSLSCTDGKTGRRLVLLVVIEWAWFTCTSGPYLESYLESYCRPAHNSGIFPAEFSQLTVAFIFFCFLAFAPKLSFYFCLASRNCAIIFLSLASGFPPHLDFSSLPSGFTPQIRMIQSYSELPTLSPNWGLNNREKRQDV